MLTEWMAHIVVAATDYGMSRRLWLGSRQYESFTPRCRWPRGHPIPRQGWCRARALADRLVLCRGKSFRALEEFDDHLRQGGQVSLVAGGFARIGDQARSPGRGEPGVVGRVGVDRAIRGHVHAVSGDVPALETDRRL